MIRPWVKIRNRGDERPHPSPCSGVGLVVRVPVVGVSAEEQRRDVGEQAGKARTPRAIA